MLLLRKKFSRAARGLSRLGLPQDAKGRLSTIYFTLQGVGAYARSGEPVEASFRRETGCLETAGRERWPAALARAPCSSATVRENLVFDQ